MYIESRAVPSARATIAKSATSPSGTGSFVPLIAPLAVRFEARGRRAGAFGERKGADRSPSRAWAASAPSARRCRRATPRSRGRRWTRTALARGCVPAPRRSRTVRGSRGRCRRTPPESRCRSSRGRSCRARARGRRARRPRGCGARGRRKRTRRGIPGLVAQRLLAAESRSSRARLWRRAARQVLGERRRQAPPPRPGLPEGTRRRGGTRRRSPGRSRTGRSGRRLPRWHAGGSEVRRLDLHVDHRMNSDSDRDRLRISHTEDPVVGKLARQRVEQWPRQCAAGKSRRALIHPRGLLGGTLRGRVGQAHARAVTNTCQSPPRRFTRMGKTGMVDVTATSGSPAIVRSKNRSPRRHPCYKLPRSRRWDRKSQFPGLSRRSGEYPRRGCRAQGARGDDLARAALDGLIDIVTTEASAWILTSRARSRAGWMIRRGLHRRSRAPAVWWRSTSRAGTLMAEHLPSFVGTRQ